MRSAASSEEPSPFSPYLRKLTAGNKSFALALYSALKQEKANLFFSPYSNLLCAGHDLRRRPQRHGRGNGRGLHFNLGPDKLHPAFAELSTLYDKIQEKGAVRLHVANSLWPQKEYPFLPDYLELLKAHYGLSITPLDYVQAAEEARRIINSWVEQQTQGRIQDLIGPGVLDSLTTLVLVNAIYFKGSWDRPFTPEETFKADFTLPDGTTSEVSLMHPERVGQLQRN